MICTRMVYAPDGSRHECGAEPTHVVTIHGVDGEGRCVDGVFPPAAFCERCALSVQPFSDGMSVLVRPIPSVATGGL